jgi:hypothetical protein
MALINDPNVTAQLAALANQGTIDTNTIVSLLNSVLTNRSWFRRYNRNIQKIWRF